MAASAAILGRRFAKFLATHFHLWPRPRDFRLAQSQAPLSFLALPEGVAPASLVSTLGTQAEVFVQEYSIVNTASLFPPRSLFHHGTETLRSVETHILGPSPGVFSDFWCLTLIQKSLPNYFSFPSSLSLFLLLRAIIPNSSLDDSSLPQHGSFPAKGQLSSVWRWTSQLRQLRR